MKLKQIMFAMLVTCSLTGRSQAPEGFEGSYDFFYAVKDTVYGRNVVRVRFHFKEITPLHDLIGVGFINLLNENNRQVNLVLTDVKRNGDTIGFMMKGPGTLLRKGKIIRRKENDYNQYVKRDLILIEDKGFEDKYLRGALYHFNSRGEELSNYEASRSTLPVYHYMPFNRHVERRDLKAELLSYVNTSELPGKIRSMEMVDGPFKYSAKTIAAHRRRLKELEAQKKIIESADF